MRKRTWFLTSSEEVAEELKAFQCSGDHEHEWCIGGKKITEPAGHYPPALSAAIVNGLERQRKVDFGIKREIVERLHEAEVMAAEAAEQEDDDGEMDEPPQPGQGDDHGLHDGEDDDEDIPIDDNVKVTAEEPYICTR